MRLPLHTVSPVQWHLQHHQVQAGGLDCCGRCSRVIHLALLPVTQTERSVCRLHPWDTLQAAGRAFLCSAPACSLAQTGGAIVEGVLHEHATTTGEAPCRRV